MSDLVRSAAPGPMDQLRNKLNRGLINNDHQAAATLAAAGVPYVSKRYGTDLATGETNKDAVLLESYPIAPWAWEEENIPALERRALQRKDSETVRAFDLRVTKEADDLRKPTAHHIPAAKAKGAATEVKGMLSLVRLAFGLGGDGG